MLHHGRWPVSVAVSLPSMPLPSLACSPEGNHPAGDIPFSCNKHEGREIELPTTDPGITCPRTPSPG